ncbi:hypothetical protein TrVE_jg3838 [Triparma verrucosa]|uniref:glutamate--tRNA ligase n=1 Tax=Triparma verrucosa TaxID=1606542 RepID=A0A9W7F281_9STRA|nr:hypothetical protein TrVE_jg3838 [Triparma verrucosa]
MTTSKFATLPRSRQLLSSYSRLMSTASSTSIGSSMTDLPNFPLVGKNPDEEPPRVRFAPSPTGSLHVGGARTALYNWLIAQGARVEGDNDASFIVRVEDTDVARSTKESEASVLQDLEWLGLKWDEGPLTNGDFGPYRQSERADLYKSVARTLLDSGKAYPCFSTNEELEAVKEAQMAAGESPRYDGKWRDADPELVQQKIDAGDPYTVRFAVPKGARVVIDDVVRGTIAWDAEATVGDFILLRSSGVPVYNFCVAVDDATMGITMVVRAEEHLTNTLRQGLILDALGAPRPRYAHCSLILGEDQQKLSKRHGATSCNQFKEDGFLPDAMINYLSLLGWNDGTDREIFTRDELVDSFDMSRVNPSGAVFDMQKLKWINSNHLKMMSIDDVKPLVLEQLLKANVLKASGSEDSKERITVAATCLAKQMMVTTVDAATNAKAVLAYPLPQSFSDLSSVEPDEQKLIKSGAFYNVAKAIVHAYDAGVLPRPNEVNVMEPFEELNGNLIVEDNSVGGGTYAYPAAWKTFMKTLGKEMNLKGKELFHPARLAMTGVMSGQDVTKQMALLQLASEFGSAADLEGGLEVVPLEVRMEILRGFLETIPEEFRQVKVEEVKETEAKGGKGGSKEPRGSKEASSSQGSDAAADSSSDLIGSYEGPAFNSMDVRVGRITKVWKHEESDKLFCEEVDVGEDEPRQIASGLQPFFELEDLQDRKVLVLCNLKARKLAGFPSHGMVLCAGNEEHTAVKFCDAPVDAKIGERIWWGGDGVLPENMDEPAAENKFAKKKMFEKIAPYLRTNEFGVCEFLGKPIMTSSGPCTSAMADGGIS